MSHPILGWLISFPGFSWGASSTPPGPQAQQAAPGTAANASAIDPAALAKLRDRIRADRKAVVAKNLPLTEAEADKARKACFDRVAKVLPGKKAARYLQIETKIVALEKFDAAVAVPLVD